MTTTVPSMAWFGCTKPGALPPSGKVPSRPSMPWRWRSYQHTVYIFFLCQPEDSLLLHMHQQCRCPTPRLGQLYCPAQWETACFAKPLNVTQITFKVTISTFFDQRTISDFSQRELQGTNDLQGAQHTSHHIPKPGLVSISIQGEAAFCNQEFIKDKPTIIRTEHKQ
jgi:hypothetical protein